MIQTIKRFITNFSVMGLLLVPALVPATAYATSHTTGTGVASELCKGASLDVSTPTQGCVEGGEADTQVNSLLTSVINIFSVVVGVVAVIMIIIGGLRYITSGGDSGNITGAKNTILYAIIGLVIVAMAQFIVRFVIARVA